MFALGAPSAATVKAILFIWAFLPGASEAQTLEPKLREQDDGMTKVLMTFKGTEITATFDDSAASKDFMSLLPMTLTLEDYAQTEKVSSLPRRLSTEGAPEGIDPSVGDITYYAPWGNLALFYRDFGYARGLVRLGRIDSGIELFEKPGPLKVTIELAK